MDEIIKVIKSLERKLKVLLKIKKSVWHFRIDFNLLFRHSEQYPETGLTPIHQLIKKTFTHPPKL